MTSLFRTGMSLLAVFAAGCATRGNVDLLEAELRRQEDTIYSLQSRLQSAESEVDAARRETVALQQQLAGESRLAALPEHSQVLHRATGVRFEKLLTGGLNRDERPGHDLLAVALTPHDAQGEAVKLQGAIQIEALELARPEGERRLGLWSFDFDQSPGHWHNGFLGSGYIFRLPWQKPPEGREVVLHARFRTTDGREFSASHTVQIDPPVGTARIVNAPDANPFEAATIEDEFRPREAPVR